MAVLSTGGSQTTTTEAYDFNPVLEKVIGGILLYGIFRVLMKMFQGGVIMANIFEDTWGAIRKYIIPAGVGGGYTEEEAAANKAALEKANAEVEANKDRNGGSYDPTEPLIETITGIPGELQNNLFLYGIAAIIVILILKD